MTTDTSIRRQRAGLICLGTAPLLLAAATAVDPALGDVGYYDAIRADPGAAGLHSLLLHWAWLLYVPGLLALLGPVGRRGAAAAAVAWTAIMFGLTVFAALVVTDFFAIALADAVDQAAFAAHEREAGTYGWFTAGWQLPGMVGWFVAMLLTPYVAAYGRAVGWWYPLVATAGFGLYLLFAIESPLLGITGPVVLTVANILAATRLWHVTPAPEDGGGHPVFRRTVGVACLVAAPVALAVGMATMPGGAFEIAPSLASDPGGAQASAFFLHLSWLLFVPGVLTVTGRLTGRGRVFGLVAGGIAGLGLLNWQGLMVSDYLVLAAEATLGTERAAVINEAAGGSPLLALGVLLPGMAGGLLGLVLVPVAAAVGRLVRWYVPVLAGLGVVAFFVLTTGRVTGLVSPVLLLVAYALLARAVVAGRRVAVPVVAAGAAR
ncbi:hypothetical protein AB0I61_23200 [Polymorphospora rubra]|uniref:hypothetical protein n=1 Tax=Polymorphospora rubra TaxID=338584 RepID=UPI0033D90D3A